MNLNRVGPFRKKKNGRRVIVEIGEDVSAEGGDDGGGKENGVEVKVEGGVENGVEAPIGGDDMNYCTLLGGRITALSARFVSRSACAVVFSVEISIKN